MTVEVVYKKTEALFAANIVIELLLKCNGYVY